MKTSNAIKLPALVVAVAIAFTPAAALAAANSWSPRVQLTSAKFAYTPSVAVSPDGTKALATWAENDQIAARFGTVSQGKISWESANSFSSSSYYGSPEAAINDAGVGAIIWTDSSLQVQFAYTNSTIPNWGSSVDLGYGYSPSLSMDGDRVLVAWEDQGLVKARSSDLTTFTSAATTTVSSDGYLPRVALLGAEKLVAYESGARKAIVKDLNTDVSQSFGVDAITPDVAVASGSILLTWVERSIGAGAVVVTRGASVETLGEQEILTNGSRGVADPQITSNGLLVWREYKSVQSPYPSYSGSYLQSAWLGDARFTPSSISADGGFYASFSVAGLGSGAVAVFEKVSGIGRSSIEYSLLTGDKKAKK